MRWLNVMGVFSGSRGDAVIRAQPHTVVLLGNELADFVKIKCQLLDVYIRISRAKFWLC